MKVWIAAAIIALACCASGVAAAARPITTAVLADSPDFDGINAPVAFSHVRAAGATAVIMSINWAHVDRYVRPANPTDPADPSYDWSDYDRRVQLANNAGLDVILEIFNSPQWASGKRGDPSLGPGTWRPNPRALADFATAAATRYGGDFQGLPRVRYWQVWNEPNLGIFLNPQLVRGRPYAPAWYRTMVNDFSAAVKAVHPDNLVIAGGLAPFRDVELRNVTDWGPLTFMRSMLCISKSLKPTCSDPVHFDIWAHHPYVSGGPSHHATLPDDVSIADLPKMQAVLRAAVKYGHVVSDGRVKFWATEFGWDSSPPDPQAAPMVDLLRWVPEAMYRMWTYGISLESWSLIVDQPTATSFYQTGLYFRASGSPYNPRLERRKPLFEGFRFPFVAYPRKGGIFVWGHLPWGQPGTVQIQQKTGRRWTRLGIVQAPSGGTFQATLRSRGAGDVRGRLSTGETSLPFSLTPLPDRFFNPFGTASLTEQKPKHH